MSDRYLTLINQIITATLQGQIRSKEQVYQQLQAEVEPGGGELFERCLQVQVDEVQAIVSTTSADDLQHAKAIRKQRALKTIVGEWERWQKENQSNTALDQIVQTIATAPPNQQIQPLLQAIDPNQPQMLTREQIQQLAQALQQHVKKTGSELDETTIASLSALATGLVQGLKSWQDLEADVVGWVFQQSQGEIGFGNERDRGPWGSWAKASRSPGLKQLFNDLAQHQSITSEGIPAALSLPDWVELAIVLQRLQLGLVNWFDKQPYDSSAGKRLSIATFLTFSTVWSQLSQRFAQLSQPDLAEGCFQMTLQALYLFAQQRYFPLYGGLFAALSGESLQTLLDYIDQPLRQAANTQSKARILTLIGYSQRALGGYVQALQFHESALEIAREAGDRPCEIANLNHLSRTWLGQQDYDNAINVSQRALILARQTGDRLGEANALANLGCSEVFQAQEQALEPEQYERLLDYLQRGLRLAEQESDRPTQAICAHSLGMAQVVLADYEAAVQSLQKGVQIAQAIGDLFLQGLNCAYLAEAYRGLGNTDRAIFAGCLGMYWLHQIQSLQWRQPAGILTILIGQLGSATFQAILIQLRPQFLPYIGVDGYDYLPTLLEDYGRSLDD
jgi:tetratricopeptide (TPR) repeat protein